MVGEGLLWGKGVVMVVVGGEMGKRGGEAQMRPWINVDERVRGSNGFQVSA